MEVYFDDFKVTQSKGPIVQSDDYYPFGLAFNSYRRENTVSNDFLYNGKELQTDLDLGWLDYGARMYMPEIGRWGVVDPLADKVSELTPYHYVRNNPLLRIDPDGKTDFTFNKKTGEVRQHGAQNDSPDRIVKTDRNGNVKLKGEGALGFLVRPSHRGEAKVAIGGIQQGILRDGQNWKTDSQLISVGGQGQPTKEGVESFAMKLSQHLGVELKGAAFGAGSQTTHMSIGRYQGNTSHRSTASGTQLGLSQGLTPTEVFHTHPGYQVDYSHRSVPSAADIRIKDEDIRRNLNISVKYFILTEPPGSGEGSPKKIEY